LPASALHFVDPALGTDDASHGTGYGHCGYKTLTYALAHATGQIALQTAVYSAAAGETMPIVLTGSQDILCNYANQGPATLRGKGLDNGPGGTFVNVTVAIHGPKNAVYNCNIDGSGGTGFCVAVTTSGPSAIDPHQVIGADIGNCGGVAIQISDAVSKFPDLQFPAARQLGRCDLGRQQLRREHGEQFLPNQLQLRHLLCRRQQRGHRKCQHRDDQRQTELPDLRQLPVLKRFGLERC
jgi:hypothetical protein